MAVRFRIIFSFFLSALLLAGLALPGYTGIFELLDNNFYHPAVTEALIRETARDADVLNRLISDLESRFSASLGDPAVQNSFLPDQDAADIYQRSRIFGMLLESVSGLQSVRFIDANGMRVHFSTLQSDFLQSDLVSVVYRNYGEDASDLPFHDVYSAEGLRLIPDRVKGSLVFSFPFYDSLGINRGTALFSVSARALTEALATAGRIGSDENLVFCADPAGIVIGLSVPPDEKILAGLASAWAGRYRNIVPLAESDVSFSLVSVRMQSGLFYGRVVRDSVLLFPKPVKAIVLAAVFLTLFLLIFLILNVRRVPELSDREIAAPADPAPAPPGDTVLLSGAGGLPARAGEERRFDGPAAAGRDIESPRKTFTFFGVEEAEELEELAAADSEETACGAGKSGGGLLAAAAPLAEGKNAILSGLPKISSVQPVFEKEPGVSGSLEMADVDIDETIRSMETGAEEFDGSRIEVVSPFESMMPLMNDGDITEAPPGVPGAVIFEQDGVPYVNSGLDNDKSAEGKLDRNFARLVDSVVGKSGEN